MHSVVTYETSKAPRFTPKKTRVHTDVYLKVGERLVPAGSGGSALFGQEYSELGLHTSCQKNKKTLTFVTAETIASATKAIERKSRESIFEAFQKPEIQMAFVFMFCGAAFSSAGLSQLLVTAITIVATGGITCVGVFCSVSFGQQRLIAAQQRRFDEKTSEDKTTIESLKSLQKQSSEAIESLQNRICSLESELKTKEVMPSNEAIESLQRDIRNLKSDLISKDEATESLQTEIRNLKSELKTKENELLKHLGTLEQANDETRADIGVCGAAIAAQANDIGLLKSGVVDYARLGVTLCRRELAASVGYTLMAVYDPTPKAGPGGKYKQIDYDGVFDVAIKDKRFRAIARNLSEVKDCFSVSSKFVHILEDRKRTEWLRQTLFDGSLLSATSELDQSGVKSVSALQPVLGWFAEVRDYQRLTQSLGVTKVKCCATFRKNKNGHYGLVDPFGRLIQLISA